MPFEPGKSGNPKGAPKRNKFITQHLISELNAVDVADDASKLRRIVRALIDKAAEGDVPAVREILDRVEGKVPQAIEGGDEDNPVRLLHRIENVIVDPKT